MDDISNPNLEKFYGILEALALEKDFEDSSIDDETLPDLEGIKKRVAHMVADLKDSAKTNEQSVPASSMQESSRKTIAKSTKMKASNVEEDPLMAIEKSIAMGFDLAVFKVSDLKRYLEEKMHINTSVRLKSQVIDKILGNDGESFSKKRKSTKKDLLSDAESDNIQEPTTSDIDRPRPRKKITKVKVKQEEVISDQDF